MKEKYGFYFRWAVTVISIIMAGVLFFFFIFRLNTILAFLRKILSILTPVTLGAGIAYLINPIVVTLEKYLSKFFRFLRLPIRTNRFLSKAISIAASLGMLLTLIGVLLSLVIPELYSSVLKLAVDFRTYGNNAYLFISDHLENNPELLTYIKSILDKVNASITDWINNVLLIQVQNLMSALTVGIIGATKVVTNLVVGLIISVYLLISKDRFTGQCKKLLYTLLKPEHANVTLYIFRRVDRIFGGFISGKLLDSLIIGVICFIGLTILNMPYPVLVSVIVGVTNVIPFFGPYIGAIPSAFLILIVSPKQCLVFIIFILILQQIDGNIIGPKILGDSTGLTPFWVVVSILLGGGLFGFLGMLLGVPTFAVFYFLIKTFAEYRLKKLQLPTASLCYCRIEKIDPDTGHIVFLQKERPGRKSEKSTPANKDLLDALDAASTKSKAKKSKDTYDRS
ncbi:MAG: AI-2E family transporter [Lachnospiraceae bacterium]